MTVPGIDTAIFALVQAPVSAFVYSEAGKYDRLPPVLTGLSVFTLGIWLAFTFGAALGVVTVELLVIVIHRLGVSVSG
ncbi:sporulation control protein [Halarchaeum sp. P4]|uniref:sporulation control protein n=1 Tax=Halarchaeum sp. P4 TaxID=3421639 RepID=UPI003EC07087